MLEYSIENVKREINSVNRDIRRAEDAELKARSVLEAHKERKIVLEDILRGLEKEQADCDKPLPVVFQMGDVLCPYCKVSLNRLFLRLQDGLTSKDFKFCPKCGKQIDVVDMKEATDNEDDEEDDDSLDIDVCSFEEGESEGILGYGEE